MTGTPRASVTLEPLRPEHAEELFEVLDDPRLHEFIGGRPPTLDELRARFRRQAVGRSPDGKQQWLNWVVRRVSDDAAVGTVQTTLTDVGPGRVAEVAWVIGTAYQGQGLARAAAEAMTGLLRARGINSMTAHVHPDHLASAAVARSIGLRPTSTVVDGEIRWQG